MLSSVFHSLTLEIKLCGFFSRTGYFQIKGRFLQCSICMIEICKRTHWVTIRHRWLWPAWRIYCICNRADTDYTNLAEDSMTVNFYTHSFNRSGSVSTLTDCLDFGEDKGSIRSHLFHKKSLNWYYLKCTLIVDYIMKLPQSVQTKYISIYIGGTECCFMGNESEAYRRPLFWWSSW